jgi:hypothetical protein
MPTAEWRKFLALMFPDPPATKPSFSRFSTPHHFNPALGLAGGLVAVAAALLRIAAFCVVFALWGVVSLIAWNQIAGGFWQRLALVPIVLALPLALIPPMLAIGALEKWIWARRS